MKFNMSDGMDNGTSKKSQGLSDEEASIFEQIKKKFQKRFSAEKNLDVNIPGQKDAELKPANDETYYTKISGKTTALIHKKDSVTDIFAKLHNLVVQIESEKKLSHEISKNFSKENEDKFFGHNSYSHILLRRQKCTRSAILSTPSFSYKRLL